MNPQTQQTVDISRTIAATQSRVTDPVRLREILRGVSKRWFDAAMSIAGHPPTTPDADLEADTVWIKQLAGIA